MNLFDMISTAQGGQAMTKLGRQFGLNEQQSADVLRNLLPAFSTGLKRNTDTSEGLGALLGALGGGRHERYLDDANVFADAGTKTDGDKILGHLFGSKEVSRAVADRAAQQTGVGADILKSMLPYIAPMIMGALFKNGQNPLGDILGQVLGGGRATPRRRQGDDPFGPLSDILKGTPLERGSQAAPGDMPTSGADIFGSMFDADGDGSVMDDIFDAVLGARR